MSFNPSYARLGVGLGISVLLLYGLAHAGGKSAETVRYINIDGTTLRVRRFQRDNGALFEVAGWGVGLMFDEAPPSDPVALFRFNKDGPLDSSGNPGVIDFIRENMGRMPPDLLEREECSKPGCSL